MALSGEISRMKYLTSDAIHFGSGSVLFDLVSIRFSFFLTHSLDIRPARMCIGGVSLEGAQLVANNKQITNGGELYQK